MKTPEIFIRRGKWISPLLFILLISCAPRTMATEDPQQDLDNARNIWRASGPSSYTYRYQTSCFCPTEITREVIITVRDGAVESVVYADDNQPVDPQFMGHFRTVDVLFDMIQEAISNEAHEMRISYDPAYGYPVSAYVDYDQNMADEELRFTAGSLTPLQ